ncbi:isochorismate synthase, partial [Xanthomonas citri pv. citri]|nr:isochorismate synthase [Xanthomonas citri pv. citri]
MSARSLLPDLGTPATGTPEAAVPPFARAVLWAHGDDAWRGEGGWTVLLDGTDR